MTATNMPCLLWFFFSILNSRYSGPIRGSTFHGVLHKKMYKNIKITMWISLDQDLWMNSIYSLNKTPTKPTYNIKTKINNTTLSTNSNSRA
jgi:hypothetical protein